MRGEPGSESLGSGIIAVWNQVRQRQLMYLPIATTTWNCQYAYNIRAFPFSASLCLALAATCSSSSSLSFTSDS